MADEDASLLDEAAQATVDAEAANIPGVYVYSFPTVLGDERDGLVRLKVGRAGVGASDRVFAQQKTVTGWPEPPLLLRVYSDSGRTPTEMESRIHDALAAVGHERVTGRRVGREWYWTSLDALDALARLAGWKTRFANAPAEEGAEEAAARSEASLRAWESMRASGNVPGQRVISERGREAKARRRELNKRRATDREMTDDELRAYIRTVREQHPDAHVIDEEAYARWIEGIAFSTKRFRRLWAEAGEPAEAEPGE